jgi:hypothetical protein
LVSRIFFIDSGSPFWAAVWSGVLPNPNATLKFETLTGKCQVNLIMMMKELLFRGFVLFLFIIIQKKKIKKCLTFSEEYDSL